jgi:hypothetical protein
VFAQASLSAGSPVDRVRLKAGEPWWADDPFVLAHPEMFAPLPDVRVIRGQKMTGSTVEQATAAPGERRGIRR